MADEQIVVGLDIGTTKVVALIGEVSRPHLVQVVGHGIVPSRGLRKGLVVDMDEAVEAITSSLKKAESFSGYRIMGAFVAVSGAHLDSEVVTGSLGLSGDRPVTREEALMVLDSARPNPMSGGRQLLHL
ncbi:MAG TPA: cell division protein FtsA, partial [Chloroflexota bacterium]|nr:cell division protein FtsA [Chloroflexota bacterium]